jgi:hypothetical protein
MDAEKSVLDCHREIEGVAKKADPSVRFHKAFPVGCYAHQGDVYIERLPDDAPVGKVRGSRQVAVGTTIGSRHVAEGNLSVYESLGFKNFEREFTGPVVVAEERWTLTHPEHAHHSCPMGTYQVIYQREGARRVAD